MLGAGGQQALSTRRRMSCVLRARWHPVPSPGWDVPCPGAAWCRLPPVPKAVGEPRGRGDGGCGVKAEAPRDGAAAPVQLGEGPRVPMAG